MERQGDAPGVAIADETLARFIPERGCKAKMSIERKEAKSTAFMPMHNASLQRWETSVFRIGGLPEIDVWHLAVQHVEPTQGRVAARADVGWMSVTDAGLGIDSDDTPPRHAAVIGWPEEKEAQKEYALVLRGSSRLVIRSST